jgi:hypothetical protein
MPARASWGLTRRGITRFFGKTVKTLSVKHTLPILTVAAVVSVFTAVFMLRQGADAQTSPQREQGSSLARRADVLATKQPQAGNEILRQAADRVGRYASIQAKVRQRADLLGRQLVGSGTYRQLGHGLTTRLRFELRMQATDQVSNLLAVCDGKFYWRHADYDGQEVLDRVDLARVQKSIDDKALSHGVGQGRGGAAASGIALGGLPALLSGLADNFVFAQVEQDSLERLPVTVLRGQWRVERLADLIPMQRAAILAGQVADFAELPAHAPHGVVVFLGRDDLFPYRLEYLRTPSKKEAGYDPANANLRQMVVMELFEVQANVALPEATFQYLATGRPFVDATENYLK